MKKLSTITLFVITATINGMHQENWHTVKLWMRTLVFQELISNLSTTHTWETIDDKTAAALRALNKTLYTSLHAHRDKKIIAHKQWIKDTATDPMDLANQLKEYAAPSLVIHQNTLSSEWCKTSGYYFLQGIKTDLDDTLHHTLLPQSLIVGPSGNTAYYLCIARTDGMAYENIQFWKRYKFHLCSQGTIHIQSKTTIDDSAFNHKPLDNSDSAFKCYTNNDHTQLLAIEIFTCNKEKKRNLNLIISGAYTKSAHYTQQTPALRSEWNKPDFTLDSISICAEKYGGNKHFKFTYKSTDTTTCHEHYVILNHKTMLPICKIPCLLQVHLMQCPWKLIKAKNTEIIPTPQRIAHTFVETDTWPLELFKRWKEIALYILHKQKNNTCNDPYTYPYETKCTEQFLKTKPLKETVRYALVLSLIWDDRMYDMLSRRFLTFSSKNTCLASSYSGTSFYQPTEYEKPKCIDYFFNDADLHDMWLRSLVPIGPLPKYSKSYLQENIPFALEFSAARLVELLKAEALKWAEQTWDNGTVAAAWKFDDQGMRVRLYNLKTESDNHTIGDYLIQNKAHGSITHVMYETGQNTTLYIDGEPVIL